MFQQVVRVEARLDFAGGEQRFDFRGEQQPFLHTSVIQRLDAHMVARQQDRLRHGVVEGKGENAVNLRQNRLAINNQQPEQRFGVRVAAKTDASRLQLRAEVGVIVELTVIDEDVAPVGALHGLRRRHRQVQNGEADVSKTKRSIEKISHVVRTAMQHLR